MPHGDEQTAVWSPFSRGQAAQHAFVNARIKSINQNAITKLFVPTCEALRGAEPTLRKASKAKLQEAFEHMTGRLQSAALTINLDAWKWFARPNNYDTYTQMYERAVGADGVMRIGNSDPKNPAGLRAAADDKATFPKSMVDSNFAFTGLNSVATNYSIKGAASAAPVRGLKANARGVNDAVLRMATGSLASAGADLTATNVQFDPKTRQIFAALNYGRRPHGSCTDYGHSYLVLADKFKRDALYFAGDTFGVIEGKSVSADDQLSYDLLGAAFLKANPLLRTALLASCLRDGQLMDTGEKDLLFEAHLFDKLTFSGGCSTLFVSGKDPKVLADKKKEALTGPEYQTLQANARQFAQKHGLKLIFID